VLTSSYRAFVALRVLFLNPAAGLGGAERALIEMVAALRQQFPRCEVGVILGEDGPLTHRLRAFGVPVLLVPLPGMLARIGDAGAGGLAGTRVARWRVVLQLMRAAPTVAAYLRRLTVTIDRVAPDLVHSNGFKMHMLGTWAAPHGLPVIWHVHDFVSLRPLMPHLLGVSLERCSGIIANSQSVARDLMATLRDAPAVYTVYNAIDLDAFAPEGSRLDLDRIAGLTPMTDGALRVGLVATMARWKGHEVFLRALSMLPAGGFRGYVVGGPIYRTAGSQYSLGELRRMASALRLNGRVGFTGVVSDAAAAIRTLDVVVHASVAPEPFGLAVAEAFACARPVVASRSGGVLEIIRENENALTHTPGDAPELAAALARLAADPGLRQRLGTAARRTSEKSFTRQRLAYDLMCVYGAVTRGSVAERVSMDRRPTNQTP
jgi:glycosyltransferase involved in cell wall biosynthesis